MILPMMETPLSHLIQNNLETWLSKPTLTRLITLNPEILVQAQKLPYDVFKSARSVADGVGIRLLYRVKFNKKLPKITGMDLIDALFKQSLKTYILGAKPGVISKAAANIIKAHGPILVGYHHGYFSDDEEPQIFEEIKAAQPQLLLVAMGFPRQEEILMKLENELPGCIGIGVGGAMDIWSGDIQRAPQWVQYFGVEWLYRCLTSPKRIKRLGFIWGFLRFFYGSVNSPTTGK